jgi:DNA-binding transcriptional MerR regulator
MTTYPLAQVEKLTGIKAHTLRIWERRYHFLTPDRTETNIRYYSDAQLRKLLNISILTRNGYRISKVDRMQDQEIFKLVANLLNSTDKKIEDDIQGLTLSMIEMNEEKFNAIFRASIIRKGLTNTIIELIYPFLQHIGILWITEKTHPAQEHFITNLIRQKIISAVETLAPPIENSKSIVLFLPENENHELALLLTSYIARDLGWKVYYLGQNVPREDIHKVTEIVSPNAIMTILTTPRRDTKELLKQLRMENLDIPLLISGNVQSFREWEMDDLLVQIKSPKDFIDYIEGI